MTTELGDPVAGVPDVRLYLVRHGETEWSLSGRHTGHTDLALTAHGEDQARSLRAALQAVPFARVFTSPAQRARSTCALAGLAAVAETEPDVAEWDYAVTCPRLSSSGGQERAHLRAVVGFALPRNTQYDRPVQNRTISSSTSVPTSRNACVLSGEDAFHKVKCPGTIIGDRLTTQAGR